MGGRVGLKGTDGVLEEALARGAKPIAAGRALQSLLALKTALHNDAAHPTIHWITCTGDMGSESLTAADFAIAEQVTIESALKGAERTRIAVKKILAKKIDLLLFCGGDGTARDICSVTGDAVPILGIPAGVKMFSGVFATTPQRCAMIVVRYLKGEIGTAYADVLDLDEDCYRRGKFEVSLCDSAVVPSEPSYTQASKSLIAAADDESVKHDIALYVSERMSSSPGALFLLGPGSTVKAVAALLGVNKTLLGIDAVVDGSIVGHDLNEQQILSLLVRFKPGALILSPIGAQGFVLGRGNQQLSPAIIRVFGARRIWLIATPAKIASTPVLRFDTGDPALDSDLCTAGFWRVINGYRCQRAVAVRQ